MNYKNNQKYFSQKNYLLFAGIGVAVIGVILLFVSWWMIGAVVIILGIGMAAAANTSQFDIGWKTNIRSNDNNFVVQGINVGDTAAANKTALYVTDSSFKSFGMLRALTYSDGSTGFQVGNRRDVNNSGVFCGFIYKIAPDGTKTVIVEPASAVRDALGLGNTSGALPIENGGTGQATAAAALAALGNPQKNVAWQDAPVGISHYFYESTTGVADYSIPYNYVDVVVLKQSSTRGVAIATRWANSGSGLWINRLHGSTWKGWNPVNVYSTSEQIVGTWTDGKPIYRITFVKDGVTGTGEQAIGTLPRTPSTVVHMYGAYLNNAGDLWRNIPFWTTSNYYTSPYVRSDNKVYVYFGSDMNDSKKVRLTVEYTA